MTTLSWVLILDEVRRIYKQRETMMGVQRSLGELEREAKLLGLEISHETAKNGKIKIQKRDFIEALRKHYLSQKFPNGVLPRNLSRILKIESPMLCQRTNVLSEDEIKDLWEGPDWIATEKIDGCRMLIIFDRKQGLSFYSRNISVTDFLPVQYDNIYHTFDVSKMPENINSMVLDCEIICENSNVSTVVGNHGVITETQLQAVAALLALNKEDSVKLQKEEALLKFLAFDFLMVNDSWCLEDSLANRLVYLERGVCALKDCGINIEMLPAVKLDRRAFYDKIVAEGGEGIVMKNLNSPYTATESRRRDGWIKIKRTMKESLTATKAGDTLDAFVTGFELGDEEKGWKDLVGALHFSILLKKDDGSVEEHEIARISSIPLEARKQITEIGKDGNPVLIESMYKKVAEVDGQAVSSRAKRLKHARILRWREDKLWMDCAVDEKFLNDMVL